MSPRRQLAIRKGDVWAFRESTKLPLVPATILNQPAHYEASITIRLYGDVERGMLSVRRVELPCKWEDVDAYLDAHPEIPREPPPQSPPLPPADSEFGPLDAAAKDLFSMGERRLRRIIREEISHIVDVPRIALGYSDAAKAVGYSVTVLRIAVQRGDLIPSYANSRPVFEIEELKRWVRSFPNEPW